MAIAVSIAGSLLMLTILAHIFLYNILPSKKILKKHLPELTSQELLFDWKRIKESICASTNFLLEWRNNIKLILLFFSLIAITLIFPDYWLLPVLFLHFFLYKSNEKYKSLWKVSHKPSLFNWIKMKKIMLILTIAILIMFLFISEIP